MWSVREQNRMQDEILKERLTGLMPDLMKECGVEMWAVISREYNEDPLFKSLVPAAIGNAGRTVCLVFCLDGEGRFEALNVSRPDDRLEGYYTQAMQRGDEVFGALNRLIRERKPGRVHVNVSADCAIADGLSRHLYERLRLATNDSVPLVSAEKIAVRWIETRTRRELALYPEIYRLMTDIMDEVFSPACLTPGVTTTTDLEWEVTERVNRLGLSCWFSPDIDLQRFGEPDFRMTGETIREGDIVHCDVGLACMGLHTDMQRNIYIGRKGEKDIPAGIRAAYRTGCRFQDIVRGQYRAGRTGNEILAAALEQAGTEGIEAMCYCHPIGVFGRGAGPLIGLYDNQRFVPGQGEFIMHDDTCYALELNISQAVPEWDGQKVCMMLEETIAFTGGETWFMDDRRELFRFLKTE